MNQHWSKTKHSRDRGGVMPHQEAPFSHHVAEAVELSRGGVPLRVSGKGSLHLAIERLPPDRLDHAIAQHAEAIRNASFP